MTLFWQELSIIENQAKALGFKDTSTDNDLSHADQPGSCRYSSAPASHRTILGYLLNKYPQKCTRLHLHLASASPSPAKSTTPQAHRFLLRFKIGLRRKCHWQPTSPWLRKDSIQTRPVFLQTKRSRFISLGPSGS